MSDVAVVLEQQGLPVRQAIGNHRRGQRAFGLFDHPALHFLGQPDAAGRAETPEFHGTGPNAADRARAGVSRKQLELLLRRLVDIDQPHALDRLPRHLARGEEVAVDNAAVVDVCLACPGLHCVDCRCDQHHAGHQQAAGHLQGDLLEGKSAGDDDDDKNQSGRGQPEANAPACLLGLHQPVPGHPGPRARAATRRPIARWTGSIAAPAPSVGARTSDPAPAAPAASAPLRTG